MKLNVGGLDRVLRVAVGAALLVAMSMGAIGVWGWIGAVPLLTGLFGYCPLYAMVGLNSCPIKK